MSYERRRTESWSVRVGRGIDSYVRIPDVSKATEVEWKTVGRKEKDGWQQ